MATNKKGKSRGRVKVNKLKIKKEKVEELTDEEARKVKGGIVAPLVGLDIRKDPKPPLIK